MHRSHGKPARPASLVVFTDLDGTLLNHLDYSWRDAAPAVERLRRHRVPLVLNSSKTRAEIVALRRELGNTDPFVVENGAAIYVPSGYFDRDGADRPGDDESFEVELLGPPRRDLLDVLHTIRRRLGLRFEGFADFSLEDLRRHTGLDAEAARAASERDGTEPLLWLEENRPPDVLARALEPHGLRLVAGGRFLHVMGRSDKGRATERLLRRYRRIHPDLRAVALGDSANDLEMFRAVDYPVVIPRPSGETLDPGPLPGLLRAPCPGAAGWRRAVDRLLDQTRAEA